MPDPIWLDTNTLLLALKGNAAINRQLSTYRQAGRQLLVVPKVRDEILNGNVLTENPEKACWMQRPYPQKAALTERAMQKIGVTLDLTGPKGPSAERLAYFETDVGKGVPVTDSDRLVLSQVKASAKARGISMPQMITDEKASHAMSAQARKWGIYSVPTAKPAAGAIPEPPQVTLADYPPDKNGPVSNKFKDEETLRKSGLIEEEAAQAGKKVVRGLVRQAAMAVAQEAVERVMDRLKEHYLSALTDARRELNASYPDPSKLRSWQDLPRYKAAYVASFSKLTMPSKMRQAEAVMLAFTRDSDLERAKKYLDAQISKVQSAADGASSSYAKVAQEYIDAMIAADLERRGLPLKRSGDELESAYSKVAPFLLEFPFGEYAWMDIHFAASTFQDIGGRLLAFSSDVAGLSDQYAKFQKQLDDEIVRVSNELGTYEP